MCKSRWAQPLPDIGIGHKPDRYHQWRQTLFSVVCLQEMFNNNLNSYYSYVVVTELITTVFNGVRAAIPVV